MFKKTLYTAITFVLFASPALSQQDNPIKIPKDLPHSIGSDGAFTYSISIDLPEFRGLQPALALNYNSQSTLTTGDNFLISKGWSIGGLSAVQRHSVLGGLPKYELDQDVYQLDGLELLACKDASAVNPWVEAYPVERHTNAPSASCLAGGNLSAIKENYLRIVKVGSDQSNDSRFEITEPSGVIRTYTPIGAFSDWSVAANEPGPDGAFRRKWVLSSVEDQQVMRNRVQIDWWAESIGYGFAPRPKSIEYADYLVQFHYQGDTSARGYAVGHSSLAKLPWRLAGLSISNSDGNIRAYRLSYSAGDAHQRRLIKVEQLGSDFVSEASGITGGSLLGAWEFENQPFQGGQATYTEVELPVEFGDYENEDEPMRARDFDTNGVSTLVGFPKAYSQVVNSGGTSVREWSAREISFNQDREVSIESPSVEETFSGAHEDHLSKGAFDYLADVQWDLRLLKSSHVTSVTSADCEWLLGLKKTEPTFSTTDFFHLNTRASSKCPKKVVAVGNFDSDAGVEAVVSIGSGKALLYDIVGNALVEQFEFPYDGNKCGISADVDGDGVQELVAYKLSNSRNGDGRIYICRLNRGSLEMTNHLGLRFTQRRGSVVSVRVDAAADTNGDGIDEIILKATHSHEDPGNDERNRYHVYFEPRSFTGQGFVDVGGYSITNSRNPVFLAGQFVDLNDDGLADLLRRQDSYSHYLFPPKQTIVLYQGRGEGFTGTHVIYSGHKASMWGNSGADLDGDGVGDIVLGDDSKPIVHFRNGHDRGLLTSIKDPLGLVTTVTYGSSAHENGNAVPTVRQLVKSVAEDPGAGAAVSTVKYAYTENAYDPIFRKSLGFKRITAQLPAPAGNSKGPVQGITFLQSRGDGVPSWAMRGLVASTILTNGSLVGSLHQYDDGETPTTYYRTNQDWLLSDHGNLPIRNVLHSHREYEHRGSDIVGSRVDFDYSDYGQVTRRVEYGFYGAGEIARDDRTTITLFQPNLGAYIVDRPRQVVIAEGLTASHSDRSNWIKADLYRYDNSSQDDAPPTSGNVTRIDYWDDTVGGDWRRPRGTMVYDPRGNLITSTNARGNQTRHFYDSTFNLFRTRTENALGHTSQIEWNTRCQLPRRQVDPNGLATTMVFDKHCRETRRTFPDGSDKQTIYLGFGDPYTQRIQTITFSGGQTAAEDRTVSTSWINGSGQAHKITSTQDVEASVVTVLRSFDAAGNLQWESIPLTPGQVPADTISLSNTLKTRYEYTKLNRVTWTRLSDGSRRRNSYQVRSHAWIKANGDPGAKTEMPATRAEDEQCFDNDASTVCGKVFTYSDPYGNLAAKLWYDVHQTDYEAASLSQTTRLERYSYDLVGNLRAVRNADATRFYYYYDGDGNRIRSEDPGLGTWTMEYDLNGNLERQQDAEGVVTTFSYDALDRVVEKRVGADVTSIGSCTSIPNAAVTRYSYDERYNGQARFNVGKLTTETVFGNPGQAVHRVAYDYDRLGAVHQETHDLVGERVYTLRTEHRPGGQVSRYHLPFQPASTATQSFGDFRYDSAGRLSSIDGILSGISYNQWNQPTLITYGPGHYDQMDYDAYRGWLQRTTSRAADGSTFERTQYTRSASGRIVEMNARWNRADLRFEYDYRGRLLSATNTSGIPDFDQTWVYDRGGNIRVNSRVGDYEYSNKSQRPHTVAGQMLSYDANGNMTQGLDGKVMCYDNENRPLSVEYGGTRTEYVYGVGGKRLKQIVTEPDGSETTTLYLPMTEIRDYRGPSEEVVTYPHPNVRLVNGVESYLHRDHLNSIRHVTDGEGAAVKQSIYRPYGEAVDLTFQVGSLDKAAETKGWIGERYDAGAGLQYLNARYYDPELGMFLQPDWFEVTQTGVGLGRYQYSAGDPINYFDPTGNRAKESVGPIEQGLQKLFEIAHRVFSTAAGSEDNAQRTINSLAAVTGADTPHRVMEAVDEGDSKRIIVEQAAGVFIGKVRLLGTGVKTMVRGAPSPKRTFEDVFGKDRTVVENVTSRGASIERVPGGTRAQADADFDALDLSNVRNIGTGRRMGTMPDGTRVIVRPSKDGRPTIEIQRITENGKVRTLREIRYGD